MEETQAKYHHLIPQTYMSAWEKGTRSLQVEFLNDPSVIKTRNKKKIAGITDYHSIKAGMIICKKDDTNKIFSQLADCSVEIDGKIVTDTMEMNEKYSKFDKWIIKQNGGLPVNKKKIKREIEKIKIKDIESNWATKYESKWDTVVNDLEAAILTDKSNSITAKHKDYLMKFYVALDWRSFQSNDAFQKVFQDFSGGLLKEIDIPKEKRFFPFLKTAEDETIHLLLLKYYREYLNDEGVMYKHVTEGLKQTNFSFFVSTGPTYFNTSDNPSFTCFMENKLSMGLMPITPRILMAQGKCIEDTDKYLITYISDEDVKKYNEIIRENANEFVIHFDMLPVSGNK